MDVIEMIRLRATETPFKEREDTLGYAGLNLVQQSNSNTWDFEVCHCWASPPRKSAHRHVLIYSESRLVVDGSKKTGVDKC